MKINKMFMMFMFVLLLVLASNNVFALGVVPASQNMLVGQSNTYQLKIQNNNNEDFTALIDIQGDLSEYISVSKSNIKFTSSKSEEIINVVVNIPADMTLKEGEHLNYIIVRQESGGQGNVGASINLASKLAISVPYSDEAIEMKLYTTNFEKGKENKFVIESQNMGTKDITEAIPIVEIYSSTNDKLETLTGERISIKQGEKKISEISFTPDYPNGKYFARAFILYGEKTASTEKVFSIGAPEVNVDSISAHTFKLGGVASLDLIISSTWVEPIDDVYAEIDLLKGDTSVLQTKTISKRLSSQGKTNLPVFLDTKGLEPAKYKLQVTLHYLGVSKVDVFDMFMDTDGIIISGVTGNVAAKTQGGSSMTLLIIIVSFLVILNGIVVYKFVILKKRKEK